MEFAIEPRTLEFSLRDEVLKKQYVEEYEKLLLDAIYGDQTLFVTTEEVNAMWRCMTPILTGWQKDLVPLRFYSPDTDQPIREPHFVDEPRLVVGELKKEIGIVGLGKMGGNTVRRLLERDWRIVGFNKSVEPTKQLEKEGLEGAYSLKELVAKLKLHMAARLINQARKIK